MDGIVTLAERHRRRMDAMAAALPRLDAALAAYAATHGGRFIRYGSSATGRLHAASDIDLIADFSDDRVAVVACAAADALCFDLGLVPDSRPGGWCSDAFPRRATAEGIVLA